MENNLKTEPVVPESESPIKVETDICPRCHEEIWPMDMYCPNCGERVCFNC